jgi:hypothetical protein
VVDLPAPIERRVFWEGTLKPLVLDIHEGDIYLVGRVATGAGMNEWRVRRDQPYVVLKQSTEGWQRIPLTDLPKSVQPNLLGSTYTLFIDRNADSGTHVTLQFKRELDSRPDVPPEIKGIVRTPRQPGESTR